jgi:succinate dehydrogenase flavin-adding protein (antitoxin of CptAB toxin-antitoxin module)
MEQLTQMELMHIQSLMDMSSLSAKKCNIYQLQAQDDELKQIFNEAEQIHQNHLQILLDQLRQFNGKKH